MNRETINQRLFFRQKGMTLLEVLLALAILTIIASLTIVYLPAFKSAVELDEGKKQIVDYLRQVQAKAMAGDKNKDWGVRFRNPAGDDYFEIYSTATNYAGGTVEETAYISSFLNFTNPSEVDGYKDIQFRKLRGTIAAQTDIVIALKGGGETRTITVTTTGKIN